MPESRRRTVVRYGQSFPVVDHGPDPGGWDFWSAFSSTTGPGGQVSPPSWEPFLEEVLDEVCTPRSVFVDVGAWVGPVSLLASRRCARVLAFEPDPVAWRRLVANAACQETGCRIEAKEHAVIGDSRSGVAHIGRRHDRRFGDSMTSTVFHTDEVAVPACTLAQLVFWWRLDDCDHHIFKIDIEGGEEEVLAGGLQAVQMLRAPLLLSLHPTLVEDPDRYASTVAAALKPFDVRHVAGVPGGLETVLAVPR